MNKGQKYVLIAGLIIVVLAVVACIVFSGMYLWNKNVSPTETPAPAAEVTNEEVDEKIVADDTADEKEKAPATAEADVEDVEEVPGIVELRSGENAAVGLKDQAVNPVITLAPGEGFRVSSDPGGLLVKGTSIDSESMGYMPYVFNDSTQSIKVTLHTGWNAPNQRWNIHPVVFQVNDFSALREHTLMINEGEQKPNVVGFTWTGTALVADPDL